MESLEFVRVIACLMFLTPDDAAIDALSKIQEMNYEVGGKIYRDERGWYSYTAPHGDYRTGKVFISGSDYVATYHTHPDSHDLFSPQDIRVAERRKVISYIRTNYTGTIRRFEPGKSSKFSYVPSGTKIPLGDVSKGTLIARLGRD